MIQLVISHNKKKNHILLHSHMLPLTLQAIPPPPHRKHHLPPIAPHITTRLSHRARHARINHQSWTTKISVRAPPSRKRDTDPSSRQINNNNDDDRRRPPIPNPTPRKRKPHHHVLAANCASTLHPQSSQLAIPSAHPAESFCHRESNYASLRSGTPRSAIM
jgi:hypothetical protein